MQLANHKFYCNRAEELEIRDLNSLLLFHTWVGWGRVWGCQPRHKWDWGGCITLLSENWLKMPLVKTFPFIVFMTSRVHTF